RTFVSGSKRSISPALQHRLDKHRASRGRRLANHWKTRAAGGCRRLLHFAHATRHALGISAEHPIHRHRAGRHDSRCLWQRSHDLFERAVLNHKSIPKWGFATTWIESGFVDEYWKWRQLP